MKIGNFESAPSSSFIKPAIESLTDLQAAKAAWPETITTNPEFIEQIKKHQEVIQNFRALSECIPLGTSVEAALRYQHVDESLFCSFYNSLAEYFESSPANARITLYFPFELMPPVHGDAHSPELQAASARFIHAYRSAWEAQLGLHEVRANFVDGDVLEPELLQGDHPRVVKATHLIPSLIAQKILTATDAFATAERSSDTLVKDGVLDAFGVVLDKSLVSAEDIESLKQTSDPYLRGGLLLLLANQECTQEESHATPRPPSVVLSDIEAKLEEIARHEPKSGTPARTAWLRKNAREKALAASAKELARILENGALLPDPHTLSEEAAVAAIDAVREASLHAPHSYAHHQDWLTTVGETARSHNISDALTKLYSHLHATGLVSDEELQKHHIRIPRLAGPFSENLHAIEPFLREVKTMTKVIEGDPYLGERVYPITLVFGSQLKGYGTKNADADVAVFVKPGVARSDRQKLEDGLRSVFAHEKIGGKAVLFWLEAKDAGLVVRDWPDEAASDGRSSWVHVLFGAAWEGDKESITLLHHRLLTNYFYDPGTKLHGKPTRERWLEEMERDTLQYRLLHKGFERYYPIMSPMNTAHGDAIDGASAFYDPRYRRIATELYLHRVFLPQLSR